jgi:isoquinoline 1-oxidoreductase beta subunit
MPASDGIPADPATECVSRRAFILRLVSAGLVVAYSDPSWPDKSVAVVTVDREIYDPLAFVALGRDGQVTIVSHRVEMGQGIRSTLPAVLADEMGADLARARIVQAPADEPRYGNQNTDGSRSIRHFLLPMRQMGCAIRTMLEAAAAAAWSVPASEVRTTVHQVVHEPSGRTLSFGELADAAAHQQVPAISTLRLRSPEELRHIGRGMPHVGLDEIVRGDSIFGIDVRLPGQLFAVIARPPVAGGHARSWNAQAALAVPGVVRVTELPRPTGVFGYQPLGGVAVVARSSWAAIEGRRVLSIDWDDGPHGHYDSAAFMDMLDRTNAAAGRIVRRRGDVQRALLAASVRHVATYQMPHVAHAPMEPPVATAVMRDGRCTVWAATQDPQAARNEVARALAVPGGDVRIEVPLLGGGFGRKSKPDFVVEAALLARGLAGTPVQVLWTREDDIQNGYFHTICAARVEAALSAEGSVTAWHQRSTFPSIMSLFERDVRAAADAELSMGLLDLPFDVPNLQLENGTAEAHVRIGWFRSVANLQHALPVNCFADELATIARRDPLDFFRDLIGPPRRIDPRPEGARLVNYREPLDQYPIDTGRLRRVLDVVADGARWGSALPPRSGRGIAVHRSFGSYVAAIVQVIIAEDGTLSVPRVDIGIDCGPAVNPDRVRAQLEGSVVMGLAMALHGKIEFANGRCSQSNFHDYPVLRMHEAPRDLRTYIVDSSLDVPPGGVGEPGMPAIGPALLNAIAAATGRRIRRLPVGAQLAAT